MSSTRTLAALFVAFAMAVAAAGQQTCCLPHSVDPSVFEVTQQFPASGPMRTAWLVHWATADQVGLYITGAWFKRDPAEAWMRILWDARLSEIFVPYHNNSHRYYDLHGFHWPMVQATPQDAGCCGKLLGNPPVVVREVRDRGPMWKDDMVIVRGEELVLWGTLDAANYNYIMQYIFRDDGTIGFRVGATARNLPGEELTPHMHDGLWRIDVDLAGFQNDSAVTMTHSETTAAPTATDATVPFNGGVEGHLDWNALEFTEIAVMDTVVGNGREDHKIQYDLMPMRAGSSRHEEEFAHHDFWVTRYDPAELNYTQLPTYIKAGRSVTNTDVVLWYGTAMHHHPRDEDGEYVMENGMKKWKGEALLMWTGFDLRPRNLFRTTPFFP
jgi:hypothetical protein